MLGDTFILDHPHKQSWYFRVLGQSIEITGTLNKGDAQVIRVMGIHEARQAWLKLLTEGYEYTRCCNNNGETLCRGNS